MFAVTDATETEQRPSGPSPQAVRAGALDLPADEFRAIGHRLIDRIARHLESLPDRAITSGRSPDQIRALLDAGVPLPDGGANAGDLLSEAANLLIEHSLHNGHPRFMGYITSSAAPIGMLADLLAASVNANVGAWTLSPVATEIERQTVRWIADLLRLPQSTSGLLVSGGNMANMVCFWAARAAAVGEAARTGETATQRKGHALYATQETHTWLSKAADLSGLGADAVRHIATDRSQRMDPRALARALDRDLAAGIRPTMVVATAGSVSTGAVDPIASISDICRERGVWLHVDGAYGAFAAMLDDAPEDLHALDMADSVAVDPHKWLYAPLEAGCALVKEERHLREAFSHRPSYYQFGEEATNYLDLGPQNSRGFRALKVWLALRQAGRSGYQELLSEDIRLARRLFDAARAHPDLEARTTNLSITTFRFVPEDLRGARDTGTAAYLDRLNREVQARLERAGEVFLSGAVVHDRYVLRGCIVNFRTAESDVDRVPELVATMGRSTDLELRSAVAPAP